MYISFMCRRSRGSFAFGARKHRSHGRRGDREGRDPLRRELSLRATSPKRLPEGTRPAEVEDGKSPRPWRF